MLKDITPLILTLDEAPNISRSLERLSWASKVIVVDSFSTDATVAIVGVHSNAHIIQRKFDTHAQQWNFGLQETGIDSEWVLALDADYLVPDALVQEIDKLQPAPDVAGYCASFKYCVEGRPLSSTLYPPTTVLYRRSLGQYVQDGHTQRLRLAGKVLPLLNPILHDDRKSLSRWLASQSRYMQLESEKLRSTRLSELSMPDRLRKFICVAPALMFFYCLIVKRNILHGRAGLFYALQRTIAELILSLYLLHKSLQRR